MSRSTSRLAVAGVLFAGCGGLVLVADPPAAAQPPAKDAKKEKEKAERPARDADLPFGFPYERDAKKQLQAARDYLGFKDIPWNTVVPLLQNILDSKTDSFFDLEYQVGSRTEINRISVKTEANRVIGAFRKEGLEFYQQAYGSAAAAQLDEAVKANYDLARLADLSQRYFHTKAGAEGTVLLGSVYLERGNYLEAAYAFERLLARPGADDYLTPRTLFRAALALRRSGDPRHAPLAKTVADRLLASAARDGLTLGRRTYTAAQVQAELDRPVTPPRAAGTGLWAGRYGNPGRNAAGAGGPPFLSPAFEPASLLAAWTDDERAALALIERDLEEQYDPRKPPKSLPLPGFFPVATRDLVVYRGYGGLYAVPVRDLVKGSRVWRAGVVERWQQPRFGAVKLLSEGTHEYGDGKSHERAKEWLTTYKNAQVPGLLAENPLLGALAHDGRLVYYLDDIAIPPPPTVQDPNWGFNPNQGVPQSPAIADAVKAGELNAVDLETGRLQWTLGRVRVNNGAPTDPAQVAPPATEEDADKATSAFRLCLGAVFLGPPLPLNGRLYVLIEQGGVVRLLCLDPKPEALVEVRLQVTVDPDPADRGAVGRKPQVTDDPRWVPALVWQQKLGRPNNVLPGDSVRRIQGAFLAAGEGILVCPTNCGAVVGVDIMSRSLLWAHAYRKLQPAARPTYQHDPRTGQMMLPPQLPHNRWRAAAPVVAGGRVLIAAYDSDKLDCLDIRTGKLLWSTPREADDLYVGGVVNDRVLIVGKTGVRAVHLLTPDADDAAKPKEAWRADKLPATVTGHGVAGAGVFYLPVRPDGAGKDGVAVAEVWAISADTGAVGTKAAARPRSDPAGVDLARYGVGNLVVQDGLVVAQSAAELAVYPQLDVKRREMDARLAANPKDPVGLADRGELLLDDGKVKAAVADFREAARNDPPESVRRRLREKLYAAYTELLKADFAASEGFLAEYAELCELPADGDDPFEKRRREDESLRRKRQYLALLGRGREAQGRAGEAFDHYLTLAGLGRKGGDRLDPDPDDPALKARADVAARGRIDGLVHKAADPAARKLLEERVDREWAAVKAADDLPRLRDFVTVFGAAFPAGAEAELKLAETLLATGDETDARDAQVHLSGLRATAADPAVRARATEALARSLRAAGLTEDAVGLYAQLGREFAAAPVRDGKTGADYLTDVLTDKRLLPYLEPARSALPTRVRAEEKTLGGAPGYVTQVFDIEPDGELFPLFRRLRFAIDTTGAGNGQWTLRAYDRVTGAEKAMFPGIFPPGGVPPGFTSARFVQAAGHLLLVHVGPWVYCFDLADRTDKRERWRKNLLGEGVVMNQVGQSDVRGDGEEIALQFSETPGGPRVTVSVGRATVLQPGYAALLTRDGLEVIDPVSKRPLWTRKGLPDRTHLYGDARHVLLVERGADNKPLATRLLRAVDGMPVEGAPDSGPALNAAKSYRVYGRHALLAEGAGDKPRVLRLLDLATGKDVWRREFPAGSVPVRSTSPEWAGFLTPAGKLEVVAARTGRPAGPMAVDASKVDTHVKGCAEVKLFLDADRFYAVLDRGAAGGAAARAAQPFAVRTQPVNGPLYCFDRATGKRRWYVDDLFDGQRLVLDRFAELPVLVAAAPATNRTTQVTEYRVVVVEKDRGMVRLNKGLPFQQQLVFQNLTVDARAGTIDLNRGDLRVHIAAEDGRPAIATVPVTVAPPVVAPPQRFVPK